MKKIINCKCDETTWYDNESGSVMFVDAWRALKEKCKCGGEE